MTPKPVTEEFCPVIHTTVEEVEREIAQYANERQLSGDEIEALAQRYIDSKDPVEREALWEAIVRGWYGGVIDA